MQFGPAGTPIGYYDRPRIGPGDAIGDERIGPMSTATKPPPTTGDEQVTTLTFEPGGAAKFLDVLARPEGRLYYRGERVTIVAPSFAHEQGVVYLGSIVENIAIELEIGCRSVRSTLFRHDELGRGAMPDCSYYFENRQAIRLTKKGHIDLSAAPPPDLVVEVVWTHGPAEAMEIDKALRVPEVWLYDILTANLQFLHLDPGGNYGPRPRSRALPFLSPGEVLDQIRGIAPDEDDHRWRRRVRTWARDVLGPRRIVG